MIFVHQTRFLMEYIVKGCVWANTTVRLKWTVLKFRSWFLSILIPPSLLHCIRRPPLPFSFPLLSQVTVSFFNGPVNTSDTSHLFWITCTKTHTSTAITMATVITCKLVSNSNNSGVPLGPKAPYSWNIYIHADHFGYWVRAHRPSVHTLLRPKLQSCTTSRSVLEVWHTAVVVNMLACSLVAFVSYACRMLAR